MKTSVKTFMLFFLVCCMQHGVEAQSYFKNEYPAVWQRAADYTLEVAEAMPESSWSFKPLTESMSFQEQMVHLVQNLSFLSGRAGGEGMDFFKGKDPKTLNKQEVSAVLKEAFGYVSHLIVSVDAKTLGEIIEFGGVKMPRENIFYLMRDHATHHRGQAILYLRMNGVEAPDYRGW